MNTNYSIETSLPAYKSNGTIKQIQKEQILGFIRANGCTCGLQLSELTGLPQSTIFGRLNDLINDEKIMYEGHYVYKNRLRKKIILIPVQGELF